MELGSLIKSLLRTTLKNVNLGGSAEGGPTSYNYDEIVEHVNNGLLYLYEEFSFAADELVLQQYDQIQIYELHSDFAVSNTQSTEPIKWIVDTPEKPFDDRILLIQAVYDELGRELPINKENDVNSIIIPTATSVQVQQPSSENIITIIYKKAHKILTFDENDLDGTLAQRVTLPIGAKQALMLYVAYAATENHSREEIRNESLKFSAKLDQEVSRMRHRGIYNPNGISNTKLEVNGWR